MPPARQPHRELGEVADLAIESDGTAVLLRYNLVADRQPKSGTLAGRLGREERLEQPFPVFRRNTNAIVPHPDLNAFVKLAGRDLQYGGISAVPVAAPLVSGIEAVAKRHVCFTPESGRRSRSISRLLRANTGSPSLARATRLAVAATRLCVVTRLSQQGVGARDRRRPVGLRRRASPALARLKFSPLPLP